MNMMLSVDINDPAAESVVATAVEWAERMGGRLDLVHGEGARYAYEFIDDQAVRKLMEIEADRLRTGDTERLDGLLAGVPEAIRGEARSLRGNLVDTLLETAEDYDLMIVATHGRKGLAHLWLGSVAEQLVRRCSRPLVVLRIPRDEG